MQSYKVTGKTTIRLNGVKYKGYELGQIPASFGFIEDIEGNQGKYEWFNFRGLTYFRE